MELSVLGDLNQLLSSSIFSKEEIAKIKAIRLWDVIVNATSVKPGEVTSVYVAKKIKTSEQPHTSPAFPQIHKDVFFWHENDPCPQPAQLDTHNNTMIKCEYLKGYDSFQVTYEI